MATIDPRASAKIRPELASDEGIHWAGMPNPSVIFHSDDWYSIPFSLFWGGFFIYCEGAALGYWGKFQDSSKFQAMWLVPFVLVGQYFIWGRFLVDAWYKRRTYYALTNRRALIVQEGWKRKKRAVYLSAISEIEIEGVATGTIWLGPKLPIFGGRGSPKRNMSRFYLGDNVPVLADIDDVTSVYHLITDLRDKDTGTFGGRHFLSYHSR